MTRKSKPETRRGKRRSAVARDLLTPKYKQRIVKLKTRYSRKKKWKNDEKD